MDKPTVSIVIPYYNGWSMTHSLLFDLYSFENKNITEVMLIDDGSDDDAVIGGEKWWKENNLLNVRVFRFDENMGFIKAANKGLKRANGDIKVLISNDVRIRQGFLDNVISALSNNSEQLIGNVYFQMTTGWNTFGDKTFPYLSGHFLCATDEIWEKIGYFDELYCPGIFEDIDISTQALRLGIKLSALNLSWITHVGGQTIKYTPERDELTRINQEKFKNKWLK